MHFSLFTTFCPPIFGLPTQYFGQVHASAQTSVLFWASWFTTCWNILPLPSLQKRFHSPVEDYQLCSYRKSWLRTTRISTTVLCVGKLIICKECLIYL